MLFIFIKVTLKYACKIIKHIYFFMKILRIQKTTLILVAVILGIFLPIEDYLYILSVSKGIRHNRGYMSLLNIKS